MNRDAGGGCDFNVCAGWENTHNKMAGRDSAEDIGSLMSRRSNDKEGRSKAGIACINIATYY